MQLTAIAMKVGPIPPAREPDRTHFLTETGREQTRKANLEIADAMFEVSRFLPGVGLPFAMEFTEDRQQLWGRFQEWHLLACLLRDEAEAPPDALLPGESAARKALWHAAAAFRYLRGLPLEKVAHLNLHRIGEIVGGLYGCWYKFEEDKWFYACLVHLAHSPIGLSPGFTARRLCSICAVDLSECEHLPDRAYPVTAQRVGGVCNICEEVVCDHQVETTYLVHPRERLSEAVMREVSFTPAPRDPSLFVTSLEADPQPPPPPFPGSKRRCLTCLTGVCDHLESLPLSFDFS